MTTNAKRGLGLLGGGVLALLLFSALGSHDDAMLETTSSALEESAEECLESVQRGTKYYEAPACNALGALSLKYLMSNGSATKPKPVKYEIRFVEAQRMAWTALAKSESCSGRPLVIW